MAENDETPAAEDTTVIDAAAVPEPAPANEAPTATTQTGPRLRDTVWNFRSMILVAVASLLIGGAGGAAITGIASHDGHGERMRISDFRGGEGQMRFPGGQGFGSGGYGGGVSPYGQFGSQLGPDGTLPGGPVPAPGVTPTTPSAPQSGASG